MSATTGMSASENSASRKYGDSSPRALEQALVPVDVERREAGRARARMPRVRIAVQELDRAFGRRGHDRIVDAFACRHRTHRLRAVGERLRHRHEVGRDAEALRRECLAGAAEAADHLVEHEQDAVRVADLAQAREVALGRHEAAGRAGDRLDDAGGDVLGAVEVDHPQQVVGQLGAVRAFALGAVILLHVRVAHVGDAGHAGAELAPVVDEPRQRDAAEIDAVVGALARDEHGAGALAARLVVGEGDLHRGVDRLGPGVAEEDPVEIARRELGNARRELELLRMRAQERRGEIELLQLPADGLGDLPAAVARGDAEESRRGVDDPVALVIPQVHALRADDHLRVCLEFAVGRERHPVFVERDPPRRGLIVERQLCMSHRRLRVRPTPAGRRSGHHARDTMLG